MLDEIDREAPGTDGNDARRTLALRANELIGAANAGQLSSFRNKLINGAFDIWQRGTSFAPSGSRGNTVDRWFGFRAVGGFTISRQAGFSGARYCCRLQRTAADSNTNQIRLYQQIESATVAALAGKKVALSFDARKGADFSDTLRYSLINGTGLDELFNVGSGFPTGNNTIVTSTVTLSTTEARYEILIDIPANATELVLLLRFDPVGTAAAADYFEVTNVQIEAVESTYQKATPFEVRPFDVELALCQRFYEKSFAIDTAPVQNAGLATGEERFPQWIAGATTNIRRVAMKRKRAAPTVTLYNPAAANAAARNITQGADAAGTSAVNVGESDFTVNFTGYASGAVGDTYGLHWTAEAEL